MDTNNRISDLLKKNIPLLLCSIIVSASFLISAAIFSNAIINRPINASFSGSIYDSYNQSELMDIDTLMYYLHISPSYTEEYEFYDNSSDGESYSTENGFNYDEENQKLKSELQENILGGKFPDFPYVQLNGNLYFNKAAVEEWFFIQSKNQTVID